MKKRFILLELALVSLIAGWFCIHRLSSYSFGFGDFDQMLHAKVVQEMVHHGNFLVPTLDGRPYNNKPPFKMWITAGVVKVLGESTFSYRIIDGVIGTLFFVIFFLYVRYRAPGSVAAWSAFAALLACSQLFQAHGLRDGAQDGMLNLLMMGTLVCADFGSEAILNEKKKRALLLCMLGGLLLGLAFLTKSIGAFIVVPVIISFLLLRGEFLNVVRKGWLGIGAGCAFSVVIPAVYWLLRVSAQRSSVWRVVWRTEVVHRIVRGYQNKDRPFFYLNLIFDDASAVPPLILGLSLVWGIYSFFVKGEKRLALPLMWASVPVICYSFIRSRLPWYIQFSYPGMAMLVGYACSAAINSLGRGVGLYRTSSIRQLSSALLGLIFICLAYSQLWGAIHKTAIRIAKPRRILEVERIVRMLQPGLRYSEGQGRVYSILSKKHSMREERFYWEMLGSKPIRATKLTSVLDKPDLRMLIVELEQLSAAARTRRPLGFTLVEPYKKRTNWTAVLYYDEQDLPKVAGSDLIRTEQVVECKSGLGPEFSGFSQPRRVGEEYGCFVEKGVASHPLIARGGTGLSFKYEVALAQGNSPVIVQAFAGARPVGKALLSGEGVQTIEFLVPPGTVNRKVHSLTLRVTDVAGAPIQSADGSIVLYRLRSSVVF